MDPGLQVCEASLEVEVLTPVHIWTGKASIVGVDSFIVSVGGKNLFLSASEECFFKALGELTRAEGPGDLGWMAQRASSRVREALERGLCQPEVEAEAPSPLQATGIQVLLGWSHPPETSVKGLLRTAILTEALLRELRGGGAGRILDLLRASVDGITSRRALKNAARGLEALLLGATVPQTRFHYDVLQRVNVVYEGGRSEVILDLFRVKDLDGEAVADSWVTAIKPGSRFRYRILVTKPSRNLSGRVPRNLARVIGDIENLERELVTCDVIRNSLRTYSKLLVNTERVKYESASKPELSRFIDRLTSRGGVLLKLGMKTGHDSKTLTPLLKGADKAGLPEEVAKQLRELYERLKQRMSRAYGRPWDDRTITTSTHTGEPVGWVAVNLRLP